MSGKMSRNKGSRVERLVRDHFRSMGYTSERVPLSGASAAMKGDVLYAKNGLQFTAEVKSRKCSFKKIYELYFENLHNTKDDLMCFVSPSEKPLVNISTSLEAAMGKGFVYENYERHPLYKKYKRTFNKVVNLEKLLGEANILVLKDNNMPLLFVRFL